MPLHNHVKCQSGTSRLSNHSSTIKRNRTALRPNLTIPNIELPSTQTPQNHHQSQSSNHSRSGNGPILELAIGLTIQLYNRSNHLFPPASPSSHKPLASEPPRNPPASKRILTS